MKKKLIKLVIVAAIVLGLGITANNSVAREICDPPPGAGIVDPSPDTTM